MDTKGYWTTIGETHEESDKELGLIGKLLPQLKSLTGARRREYFERLVKPLFQNLEKVHTAYDNFSWKRIRILSETCQV